MRKVFLIAALVTSVVIIFSKVSFAGEVDILLNKLVEKGILTVDEAREIRAETKEAAKKEIAQGKSEALPQWIQTMKLNGDMRVRYQYDYAKHLAQNTQVPHDGQSRGRIRLRLGLGAKVNDKIKAGVGITTNAGGDPRSANLTFTGSSAKKEVRLDYAYAEYTPFNWLTLTAGKFKNPLWEPCDLIWDTDITPEGGTIRFNYNFTPQMQLFASTGAFIIGEAANDEADPAMYIVQAGLTQDLLEKRIKVKSAVSYYGLSGAKNKTLTWSSGTNSLNPTTGVGLRYNYLNIVPAVEIGFQDPLKELGVNWLPYCSLFGEYVANTYSKVPCANTGYMLGFRLGTERIEKWADWQFMYYYAKLGRDAILDILPDSDRYGGRTGVKVHKCSFGFGLGKNTWLSAAYYYDEFLKGNFGFNNSRPYQMAQFDWNVKF